jgi:trans-2,3-dihydro-3-hydroxyanthranilate isomerase
MIKLDYYIVDVFTEEKYAGNQLAVFRNAQSLSDDIMQKIARETNYSETTFILSDEKQNDGYNVRIFTPKEEVPFAGHPTLGTAYLIQREIIKETVDMVPLNLKVGQIPVTINYINGRADILFMKQIPPLFGKTLEPEPVQNVLGLRKEDISSRFPVQEVSTGLPFIIVPLNTIEALKKSRIDHNKYFELISDCKAKAILVFSPETHQPENDLSVRVFANYYGVPEDPATGSANGCLAGYLTKYRYLDDNKINIRVEQGYEINRPSLLYLRAEDTGGEITVSVGGKAVMVARGEFI